MKKQFQKIGSLLGIATLVLVGFGVVPVGAQVGYEAVADIATTDMNTPVIIDVFANDIGSYDEYKLFENQRPNIGSTEIVVDQGKYKIKYYPQYFSSSFGYTDSFQYRIGNNYQNAGRVTVNVTALDSDGDGIFDYSEYGDFNSDNIPDKDQSNVVQVIGGFMEVPLPCEFSNFRSYYEAEQETTGITLNNGQKVKLQIGTLSNTPKFEISNAQFDIKNCQTAQVELNLIYSTLENFNGLEVYKKGLDASKTYGWFDFKDSSNVTFDNSTQTISIKYSLTDGGIGDNGTDGIISDPIVVLYPNPEYNSALPGDGSTRPLIRTGGIF
jgi:hypothetical protein